MASDIRVMLNDSVDDYQRNIRERTTESYFELRSTLDTDPAVTPARRRARSHSPKQAANSMYASRSPRPTSPWEYTRPVEQSDYSYGASVNRLSRMLNKYESTAQNESRRNVQFTPRGLASSGGVGGYGYMAEEMPQFNPYPRGELPTPEVAAQILQNHSSLMQQIEIENNYVRDEMQKLRLNFLEVAEENRLLHEELKRGAISEILGEGMELPGVVGEGLSTERAGVSSKNAGSLSHTELTKWQRELERIQGLHTAKAERLETQLSQTKTENERYEQQVCDLKARVRILETVQGSGDMDLVGLAAGICVRCAQNEAVLPPSVADRQKSSIDKLTRERDEVITQMSSLKLKYNSLKQREEDAYGQVKKSVEMVEQAQLEQTQALIQKEQLREELVNMRNRLEDHVQEITRRLSEERELVRMEYKQEREELTEKIKELTEAYVTCQSQLEKTTRDKISLLAEVEAAKGQMDNFDLDYGKATDSMKMTMTHATIERNKAVQEMVRLKKEAQLEARDHTEERSKMKSEMENIRGRLQKAEREVVEAKEQCITLTNNMHQLEREAHMAKLAKDTVEKNRSDDVQTMTRRAGQREAELTYMIDSMETKYTQTVSELEDLVHQHESLVHKLQEECKRLAGQLENVTARYKRDNRSLKSQNEQLKTRLERAMRRLTELENQHTQGGILQEKMRLRIKQMDEHAMHTSTQLLELLAREGSLMKDRSILAREVEFLRRQLMTEDTCHLEKLLSAQHGLVDDILSQVRSEQISKVKENIQAEAEYRKFEEDELAKDYGDEKDVSSLETDDLMD